MSCFLPGAVALSETEWMTLLICPWKPWNVWPPASVIRREDVVKNVEMVAASPERVALVALAFRIVKNKFLRYMFFMNKK